MAQANVWYNNSSLLHDTNILIHIYRLKKQFSSVEGQNSDLVSLVCFKIIEYSVVP